MTELHTDDESGLMLVEFNQVAGYFYLPASDQVGIDEYFRLLPPRAVSVDGISAITNAINNRGEFFSFPPSFMVFIEIDPDFE